MRSKFFFSKNILKICNNNSIFEKNLENDNLLILRALDILSDVDDQSIEFFKKGNKFNDGNAGNEIASYMIDDLIIFMKENEEIYIKSKNAISGYLDNKKAEFCMEFKRS